MLIALLLILLAGCALASIPPGNICPYGYQDMYWFVNSTVPKSQPQGQLEQFRAKHGKNTQQYYSGYPFQDAAAACASVGLGLANVTSDVLDGLLYTSRACFPTDSPIWMSASYWMGMLDNTAPINCFGFGLYAWVVDFAECNQLMPVICQNMTTLETTTTTTEVSTIWYNSTSTEWLETTTNTTTQVDTIVLTATQPTTVTTTVPCKHPHCRPHHHHRYSHLPDIPTLRRDLMDLIGGGRRKVAARAWVLCPYNISEELFIVQNTIAQGETDPAVQACSAVGMYPANITEETYALALELMEQCGAYGFWFGSYYGITPEYAIALPFLGWTVYSYDLVDDINQELKTTLGYVIPWTLCQPDHTENVYNVTTTYYSSTSVSTVTESTSETDSFETTIQTTSVSSVTESTTTLTATIVTETSTVTVHTKPHHQRCSCQCEHCRKGHHDRCPHCDCGDL